MLIFVEKGFALLIRLKCFVGVYRNLCFSEIAKMIGEGFGGSMQSFRKRVCLLDDS